jgi:tetratricopeptide (TPR) repeat protein
VTGRFSRLEVSLREAPEPVAAIGVPVRTETDDMSQAREAFRRGRFEPALRAFTGALGRNRSLVPAWAGQVQMLVELQEYAEARLWSDKALELFRNNGDLLAAKSRACLRQGDKVAAIACSDASMKSPGSSPSRWQARGEAMLSESAPRARDCFEKSLAEPEADWFERVVIARAYLFHKRPGLALEYADAAAAMRPSEPYAWIVLGECRHAAGFSGRAQACYERALELDPSYAEAREHIRLAHAVGPAARLVRWVKGAVRR